MSFIKPKTDLSFNEKLKQSYPLQYFVNFAIAGIVVLFSALLMAYLLSHSNWDWKNFNFPKVFLISTIVLGCSSYTMHQAIKFYKNDEYKFFKGAIALTFILGSLFCFLQVLGWVELHKNGIYIAGKPDGSYLYLLTAMHAIHLIAGIIILASLLIKIEYRLKEPVSRLIYFSDDYQLVKLKLLAKYWHFVDILWVVLLLFFLFNHL